MWDLIVLLVYRKEMYLKALHLILNTRNKMSLFNDFKNRYPSANLDKFTFVSDSYGGYIKWKYNGLTVMTNDDPTGKTWTDGISPNMKRLLWKDLGLNDKELVHPFGGAPRHFLKV